MFLSAFLFFLSISAQSSWDACTYSDLHGSRGLHWRTCGPTTFPPGQAVRIERDSPDSPAFSVHESTQGAATPSYWTPSSPRGTLFVVFLPLTPPHSPTMASRTLVHPDLQGECRIHLDGTVAVPMLFTMTPSPSAVPLSNHRDRERPISALPVVSSQA